MYFILKCNYSGRVTEDISWALVINSNSSMVESSSHHLCIGGSNTGGNYLNFQYRVECHEPFLFNLVIAYTR